MLELNGPRQSLTVLGLNAAGINATGAREMEFGSEVCKRQHRRRA